MSEVVLTADRGSFTDYGGGSALGYVACMPHRLVPRLFMDKFFTPPATADENGRAILAPYALRKVEATLVNAGFNTCVSPPEKLEKVVSQSTKVLGVTVHDPMGVEPVTFKLTMLFGGGKSWTAKYFEELGDKIRRLKQMYGFRTLVGGPGAWQVQRERPEWVDVVFIGHAELDLPPLINSIVSGKDVPRVVFGRNPRSADEIPLIVNPARFGEVQVTRGCPRGCQFCSITPDSFITIPVETVLKEVEVNLRAGQTRVDLVTDDILLYGAQRLRVNHEAVTKLFSEVKKMGVESIGFPHISAPAVRESPRTVRTMSEIAGYSHDRANAPVVGLETGSLKIFNKYMRAKSFPWEPAQWKDVVLDATAVMNESHIYPCYTMTIGYPEETDDDVQASINLVQSIIDHDYTAWIFPLPVIPMGTSRIRDNPMPALERLPQAYWDLLYMSWKYDLKVTRSLVPTLTWGMQNRFVRWVVQNMIDRIFNQIEWVFSELKQTRGRSSLKYKDLNLNTTLGVIKSVYWLLRVAFKP